MAAQRVLQLLRSSNTYLSFDAAKSAIEAIQNKKDGEIVLARYGTGTPTGEPGSEVAVGPFFSAIGVYDLGHTKWTVFKSSTEFQAALDALQAELDRTQAGAGLGTDGSYTAPTSGQSGYEILGGSGAPANIKDAVMKLADEIGGMDHSFNWENPEETTTDTDYIDDKSLVVSAIKQTNGDVDAQLIASKDLLLTGYQNTNASSAIAGTDTLENALSKLENATSTGVQVSEKTGNQITRITGDSTAANNGLYSHVEIVQLTAAEITALNDANVREAYKLVKDATNDRAPITDIIKIYKDSSLVEAYLGHVDDSLTQPTGGAAYDHATNISNGSGSEALCFVYYLADGTYSLVAVNLESFLQESEFKDGLTVSSNEVSVKTGNGLQLSSTADSDGNKFVEVKKDSNSEQVYTSASTAADVLTVSSNGVKVANVQNAINYATDQVLSTTVTSTAEVLNGNSDKHIVITESTDQTTHLHSYAITEQDIASEDQVNALTGQTLGSAMTYSGTPTYIGQGVTNTITSDLEALDAAAANGLDSVSGSDAITVGTKDANKDQSISLKLETGKTGTGLENTGADNALTITDGTGTNETGGLFLSTTWDCGVY